jgi:hypothetical protein
MIKPRLLFDTIHSVKGGEADNVLIYEKANWPSHFSTKKWNRENGRSSCLVHWRYSCERHLTFLRTTHDYYFPMGKIFSDYERSINDN